MKTPLLCLAALLPLACANPEEHASPTPDSAHSFAIPVADSAAADIEARQPWTAPPLERLVSVHESATGARLDLATLLDRLAAADAVFLGESHTDASTHRAELAVLEGLLARRGDVVLALEMFERDVQPQLDAYLRGEIDEATFLAGARPWGNYRTGYRPLVEASRAAGQPVIASNFPRPLRGPVASSGLVAITALRDVGGEAARQVPAEILANTPEYHRRVDNAIRGHLEMMRAHGAAGDDGERLTSTQTLWDNSMGDSTARALDEHPGAMVLHVNGGFHSEYRDGTVRQLLLRRPQTRVLTVAIVPSDAPSAAEPSGVAPADYVLYVQRRETEETEGWWSVQSGRELRFKLHVPDDASAAHPAPLVLWLAEDGLSADDGMELLRTLLGDGVAIAAFEAPYRETQLDLSVGGRWFWSDTFAEDLGNTAGGIAQAWAYLMRQFPLDPQRSVLAGEGGGATVVAATALFADDLPLRSLALRPRHFEKIKDMPLPLPEYAAAPRPATQSLTVVTGEAASAWWNTELQAYRDIDMDARQVDAEQDPWRSDAQVTTLLRDALGLEPREATDGGRAFVPLTEDAPRARAWARLLALRHTAATGEAAAVLAGTPDEGSATQLAGDLAAADFGSGGHALPLCPGPFGGTTVLVLPDGLADAEREAWLALAASEPLQKHSRFHRLRMATPDGERGLAAVLEELVEQGRTNVLVVPATFHAGGTFMRELAARARPIEDALTLHWLPGLGGAL